MTTALEIIRFYGGNESTGMCCCPAHDDKHPSLHIEERNGKVVWHCHAGCSQEAVLAAFQRHGFFTGKDNNKMKQAKRTEHRDEAEKDWERFQKAWQILRCADPKQAKLLTDYFRSRGISDVPGHAMFLPAKDAERLTGIRFPAMVLPVWDGNLLCGAQVTFLTKDYQDNAKGRDGKSVRRLYGKVSGGYISFGPNDPNKPLLVTEGTEDALSVAQLTGLPAIAAGSANLKAIDPPLCSELIICGDNDEPGRQAAKAAADQWPRVGRKIRIAIPRNHKDWNEALCDPDADPDALRDAILHARAHEATAVTSLGMLGFMDLKFPRRQFLLRPWLTTTGLVMIDAPTGHGKTWFVLSVGYAAAAGKPLLGWESERKARVLYVDGELPGELLQQRLRLLGPDLPDTDFRVFAYAQFAARGKEFPDLGTKEGRAILDNEIEEYDIELIILDSVSTVVRSGVDNDVESWRAVQDWSLKHRARGRTVIYLHHHGRSGNPRGTSTREIVLDARIKMTRDEKLTTENETAFKLEFAKARDFHGAEAAPMIAYLNTQDGIATWRAESVKASNRERVRELVGKDWSVTEIAEELGVSKGRVSQLIKELGLKAPTPKAAKDEEPQDERPETPV